MNAFLHTMLQRRAHKVCEEDTVGVAHYLVYHMACRMRYSET